MPTTLHTAMHFLKNRWSIDKNLINEITTDSRIKMFKMQITESITIVNHTIIHNSQNYNVS